MPSKPRKRYILNVKKYDKVMTWQCFFYMFLVLISSITIFNEKCAIIPLNLFLMDTLESTL